MNQQEKKKFIRDLCNSVRDELIGKVGRMPKEWDGRHLREIAFRKFQNCTHFSGKTYINDELGRKRDKRDLREFNADYYSSNL